MISKVSFDRLHQGTVRIVLSRVSSLNDKLQKRTEQGRRCEVLGARSEVEALYRPTMS